MPAMIVRFPTSICDRTTQMGVKMMAMSMNPATKRLSQCFLRAPLLSSMSNPVYIRSCQGIDK